MAIPLSSMVLAQFGTGEKTNTHTIPNREPLVVEVPADVGTRSAAAHHVVPCVVFAELAANCSKFVFNPSLTEKQRE